MNRRRDEFTDQQLREVWENSRNVPEGAETLGVNRKSLWRWLNGMGIDTRREFVRTTPKSDWGSFATWLRKNKGPIPRSVDEIAKASGCTKRAVESYLYRRKSLFKARARTYVEHYITRSTTWPDGSLIGGDPIYTIDVDFFSHKARVQPEGAEAFEIGAKAPDGYKRKKD